MNIKFRTVFGAGFMLATSMASFAAYSQDVSPAERAAEIDALEPGFDTSGMDPDVAEPAADGSEAAPDVNDPAEPTAVLARDLSRRRTNGAVMDSIELSATEITGNQELPKVMVIVPWQKAEPGDLVGKPVNTLLDEVLAPIDREEFIRSVDYYGDVYGSEEE